MPVWAPRADRASGGVGHPLPGTRSFDEGCRRLNRATALTSADRRSRRGRCRGPIELGGRGPHFGGWEIYHLKASPADPDRLYASQSTGWFGQVICHDPAGRGLVRVVLPAHLRTLARVDGEVKIEVAGPVTRRAILDALEASYPMLRGTITLERRPFLRFFACEEELTHKPPEAPLCLRMGFMSPTILLA